MDRKYKVFLKLLDLALVESFLIAHVCIHYLFVPLSLLFRWLSRNSLQKSVVIMYFRKVTNISIVDPKS